MSLPEILTKLRTDRKWTQNFAAEMLKVDRSTISKYETGKVTPTYQTLVQMAEVYKVDKTLLTAELESPSSYSAADKSVLKENPDDKDMEMIREIISHYPDLKKALLDIYTFNEKKKALAVRMIKNNIHALKEF
ncbi:helix-turn-helix domain-containing protein [Cytobacillus firmus]|uniref:helix-turn-helix domain-containing protein n=1 Tax=Cytobacillus firmus TaxID=1399 RepID=UPI002493EC76|nr:helix-turn-helix transcriptional regulator [Cytobacillus firmus]